MRLATDVLRGYRPAYTAAWSEGLARKLGLADLSALDTELLPMMVEGKVEQGWPIVERAHGEHPSRQVRMIRALAALHDRSALWARIGRPILVRRLRQFREGY